MKIGIIKSSTFPQMKLIDYFIRDLPLGVEIVYLSEEIKDIAEKYNMVSSTVLADTSTCKTQLEYAKAYQARNEEIASNIDLLVAFTEKDKGGTWELIKTARRHKLPTKITRPSLLFTGESESLIPVEKDTLIKDIVEPINITMANKDEPKVHPKTANKGKGLFHLRRINPGSYALKLKRYLDPIDVADFINDKAADPVELAKKLAPEYIKFFNTYKQGIVHCLTTAPRSIRNLEKVHLMDEIVKLVSLETGIPYETFFKAWDKKERGTHVDRPINLEITPVVKDYIGKVVFVLDDVVTTGNTLKTACEVLTNLEIHNHGLAYIFWT